MSMCVHIMKQRGWGMPITLIVYKQFKDCLLKLGREHVLHKPPSMRLGAAQTRVL